jgi:uncharacterized protein (TIGR02266 family)
MDLRRLPRVPFVSRLCVVPSDGTGALFHAWSQNLSLGGMYVRTAKVLGRGTRVTLALETNDHLVQLGEAEVAWERGPSNSAEGSNTPSRDPGGFGVRFVDLRPEAKTLVEAVVRHGGSSEQIL